MSLLPFASLGAIVLILQSHGVQMQLPQPFKKPPCMQQKPKTQKAEDPGSPCCSLPPEPLHNKITRLFTGSPVAPYHGASITQPSYIIILWYCNDIYHFKSHCQRMTIHFSSGSQACYTSGMLCCSSPAASPLFAGHETANELRCPGTHRSPD